LTAKRIAAVLALVVLMGCTSRSTSDIFAGGGPSFDPISFYTGRTHSWGVEEDRSGAPEGVITTDCVGEAEGSDGLHMVQHLTMPDGAKQTRDWHMRRVGPHRYEATANDMVGTASGESQGRNFHWTWTLATKPGNALYNVTLEQWMYLMDDGAMVNRTIIRKFGVVIAEVTEQFDRVP
jgi:hypothetical protein